MVAIGHMVTAGAGVGGYVLSKKYGSKIPGGNLGKIAVGAGLAIGGSYAPEGMRPVVVGLGVGVLADGVLSYAGL